MAEPVTDADMAPAATDADMAPAETSAVPQKWPHNYPVPHEAVVAGKPPISESSSHPVPKADPEALLNFGAMLVTGTLPHKDAKPGTPEDLSNLAAEALRSDQPMQKLQNVIAIGRKLFPGIFAQFPIVPEAKNETRAETVLNQLGTAAKGVSAIPGSIESRLEQENIPVVSKALKSGMGAVRGAMNAISEIPTVIPGEEKLVNNAVNAYDKFATQHPRTANALGDVANIAGLGVQLYGGAPIGAKAGEVMDKTMTGIPGAVRGAPAAIRELPGEARQAVAGTLTKAGNVAEKMAAGTEGRVVPIKSPEFNKGAANALYTKYNVFGNPEQVQAQWNSKIHSAYTQLKEKISSIPMDYTKSGSSVNVAQVINRAGEKVINETRLSKLDMAKVISNVKDNLTETYGLDFKHAPARANNIDLAEAQLLKQETGLQGDWHVVNGKMAANKEASNIGTVYNAFYDELKKELENKGGPGIKELNKQMSEMIPMERAARKQILISGRKDMFSLSDFLGLGVGVGHAVASHGLSIVPLAANLIGKSPAAAKVFNATGKALKSAGRNLGDLNKGE